MSFEDPEETTGRTVRRLERLVAIMTTPPPLSIAPCECRKCVALRALIAARQLIARKRP